MISCLSPSRNSWTLALHPRSRYSLLLFCGRSEIDLLWLFYPETLIILIPALILAIYAQYKVSSTYNKYAQVPTQNRVTAIQVVQSMLARAGVSGVSTDRVARRLGDYYDPRTKTLKLSAPDSDSVASVGVAAHEAGHAIQHAQGYAPLALRSIIVPFANFGSQLAIPLFFLGLIFMWDPLLNAGLILYSVAVLFTLITLPVELNASRRAVTALSGSGLVNQEELKGIRSVLSAAALTYVAAAATAIAQLLGMLLIAGRRD